ncbi:unnamed protein product [Protopolystoma xenopodis]|uniref:Uncharacterized protein n=1 Tax=Protopolystoma xenopodis TaxID=117903 RepID=A0A3S5FFE0_9PLAT|nr:unnamed protein product [Protopolystoma xenopodis]
MSPEDINALVCERNHFKKQLMEMREAIHWSELLRAQCLEAKPMTKCSVSSPGVWTTTQPSLKRSGVWKL